MLLCETTGRSPADAEDCAIFAGQLARLGISARIDVGSVPKNPGHNLQFDLAPLLSEGGLRPGDGLALLAADLLTDEALTRLRRLSNGVELTVHAYGSFASGETALGVRARLSYVFNREPELHDITPADASLRRRAPVFGVARHRPLPWRPGGGGAPRLLLVGPDLSDRHQAAALSALAIRRRLRCAVLTDSKSKQAWIAAHGHQVPFFHYGEVMPAALAEQADLAIFFGSVDRSYRLQTLVANLLGNGLPLLDGTATHRLSARHDAFIPGPPGLIGLDGFLDSEILPNLAPISEHVQRSRAASEVAAETVVGCLGAELASRRHAGKAEQAAPPAAGGVVFMPTNGIGLGHAQRCALIASEFRRREPRPVFAAFPSCIGMIKSYGFDAMPLVGRSQLHAQSHENDLANYLRLLALSAGARALVFDGGYVFDSVYRTLLAGEVRGVWVRRGLWQQGQDNSVALDREKVFERVIVPSEAFEELNSDDRHRDHVFPVGPVVQRVALSGGHREELRSRLAERYGRTFDRLVVSLLGAGVAASRAIQIQALCSLFERRSDTLHIVLVWPSGLVEPGWFGWRNSRVVQTRHAATLAAAADLAVTACGYNSFHETLYNRVPAIFVPQLGPSFMDDQKARARAACDRGLAAMVDPSELMRLERLVLHHLDGGEAEAVRARLGDAELPEPGTRRAAELIEEVAYGPSAVEQGAFADRAARRG